MSYQLEFFGAHAVNLQFYSGAFPSASTINVRGIPKIELVESSEVVMLMLQYMHNKPQPDSEEIEFKVMKELAEAVEKYEIYSAMEVCKLHMKNAAKDHPLDVLAWATRHNYMAIANLAAPLTLGLDFEDVSRAMGSGMRSWAIRDAYQKPEFAGHDTTQGCGPCDWDFHYEKVMFRVLSELVKNGVKKGYLDCNVRDAQLHAPCKDGSPDWQRRVRGLRISVQSMLVVMVGAENEAVLMCNIIVALFFELKRMVSAVQTAIIMVVAKEDAMIEDKVQSEFHQNPNLSPSSAMFR
ncbi:hypothetical protein BDN72DRAFT_865774 [Pluteus cervinus]|uniref:Uncharacterized protein n=1 Tax=Pluteus cervinus TaxID=181527 RepID=A0ACD2ZYY6_9AGAR|nr:hypothetical protein BDN72DRAFT_865774 [Pluteus cervinus]